MDTTNSLKIKNYFSKKKDKEIDLIANRFSESIKVALKENLVALIIYGSRARGDAKEYSDYDYLLIVNKNDSIVEDNVSEISGNIFIQYDKLVTYLIWEEKDWELKKRFPIGKSIIRDGILL